jgi:fatty acid desaturase
MGASSQVYRRSHDFGHHACVNHYELDRAFDTTFPYMRLHSNQPRFWFHRWQQYYAWPLYAAVNFGDLFTTFDEFFRMSNYPIRAGYSSFGAFLMHCFVKTAWLFWAILIPSFLHGFQSIFWVWFLYMTSFSIGYAVFFAINHWVTDAGFVDNSNISNTNWGVLQAANSINFALDSWFWTNVSGGLNHQIEHHLFPSMMHTRLPEI